MPMKRKERKLSRLQSQKLNVAKALSDIGRQDNVMADRLELLLECHRDLVIMEYKKRLWSTYPRVR